MRTDCVSIVRVRTNLGLVPGVEQLGDALLDAGLTDALGAPVAATVDAPPYSPVRDHRSGLLNAEGLVDVAHRQAVAVGAVIDEGGFFVVLGGDDSVLFGSLAALGSRGRHGLVFLDAHTDFYDPLDSPTGQASDSDMFLALGNGSGLIAEIGNGVGLVDGPDAVLVGHRDPDEPSETGAALDASGALVITLADVRRGGIEHTATAALEQMVDRGVDRFLIHVDADVLNDAIMPAVDYRLADGFTQDEFSELLARLLSSELAAGLDVAIYNPRLDPDRKAARQLCDGLVGGFDAARGRLRGQSPPR